MAKRITRRTTAIAAGFLVIAATLTITGVLVLAKDQPPKGPYLSNINTATALLDLGVRTKTQKILDQRGNGDEISSVNCLKTGSREFSCIVDVAGFGPAATVDVTVSRDGDSYVASAPHTN